MNPNRYVPLSRLAVSGAVAIAVVATAASVGAVLALFDSASSTPWLSAEHAALVAHCDGQRATTQRRACVQAALRERAALRLAARQ